jgi:hypothetical protein
MSLLIGVAICGSALQFSPFELFFQCECLGHAVTCLAANLTVLSIANTSFIPIQVESLAKKYEEKYKQVAELASKLAVEEHAFRDVQVVYHCTLQ